MKCTTSKKSESQKQQQHTLAYFRKYFATRRLPFFPYNISRKTETVKENCKIKNDETKYTTKCLNMKLPNTKFRHTNFRVNDDCGAGHSEGTHKTAVKSSM